MKILVLKEKKEFENRVALTPDLISKYNKIGYDIVIESEAGVNSNISDEDYKKSGAKISKEISKELPDSDIVLVVNSVCDEDLEKLSKIKNNAILLGSLNPYQEQDKIKIYEKYGIRAIAAELFPRITRAQSMDILSSQSNLAGYRAVIDAVYHLSSAVPMMMTAAGTVSPAKIMVMGAGVAGLQAIATAKRLGGVVSAFDVRAAAKEQVQSLGAKFIEVENSENSETQGGYAKEMSEEYKKRQEKIIFDHIAKQDIVITTALIPGKPAPKLISKKMVENMKGGSVIVDMAAAMGGNCELTKKDEIVYFNDIKIIGYGNIASRVAINSSRLFAKNLYNFIDLITDKESKTINLDLNDEIIKSSLITKI